MSIDHFKYLEEPVPLESCSGAFNVMFKNQVSGLPVPGLLTLFRPVESETVKTEAWDRLESMIRNGSLFEVLQNISPLQDFQADFDTTEQLGYSGKKLFISFSFQDRSTVDLICNELAKRRHRYFCLADPFGGVGHTPRENSVSAVKSADAVLLLFSPAYADRYRTSPNGNLAAEVLAMVERKRSDPKFEIFVLSTVSFRGMEDCLPWSALGFVDGQVPMVGDPLAAPSIETVSLAVTSLKLA